MRPRWQGFGLVILAFAMGILTRAYAASSFAAAYETDAELSTPRSSAWCRREGVFLLRRAVSPLEHAGPCPAHPPLLLSTLGAMPPSAASVTLLLADLLSAAALLVLPSPVGRQQAAAACATVLLSPWNVVACAAGSSAALPGLGVLVAVCLASLPSRGGSPLLAAATLGMATHLAPDMGWMVFSVAALVASSASCATAGSAGSAGSAAQSPNAPNAADADTDLAVGVAQAVRFVAAYALSVLLLAHVLTQLEPAYGGSAMRLLGAVLGQWLGGPPIHDEPALGLWWYISTEVFLPLRPFLVAAFHVLPRLCVPCLALRLWPTTAGRASVTSPTSRGSKSSPPPSLMCAALSLAIVTVTQYTLCVAEVVMPLCLLATQVDRRVLSCTRHLPLAGGALAFGLLTVRPTLSRWLDARELNANFFYAAALALSGGQLLGLHDVAAAAIQATLHEEANEAATVLQRAVGSRRRATRSPERRAGKGS